MYSVLVIALAVVASAQIVPNEWVATFRPEVTAAQIKEHMNLVATSGATVLFEYDFGGFRGYSVRTPANVSRLAARFLDAAELELVEANQVYTVARPHAPKKHANKTKANADCTVQQEATWGLVRVAEEDLNIDGYYPYDPNQAGQGVTAYVIDTGIYMENVDFERRATWGFDAVSNPSPETDGNGHGTHCAGTIGGKDFGVAKNVDLVAVRVLNNGGSGTTAGVIAGIQFTGRDGAGKKSVGSMSLGGGYSAALNQAVAACVSLGVPIVVAAGNSAADACNFSPASEETAITVMCSDSDDSFCYFSNWGTCADVIAPGMGITSAWIGSPVAQNTISGTSMSCPHVAGVVAKMLSASAAIPEPAALKAAIISTAGDGYITGVIQPTQTPNKLLYTPCF